MRFYKFVLILLLLLANHLAFSAQTLEKQKSSVILIDSLDSSIKTSPAYAEVLLEKTNWEAEMQALLINYTEEFPKVVEAKYQIAALKKEMDRLLAAKINNPSRLTLALGKLMTKKAELQTGLWILLKKYDAAHIEVKQIKRKMEIYEAAIKDILG